MEAADRWGRKKRELLRNFIVNPGFCLSPIPEDERSSPDTNSGSLPDLVVEPAPNRHDDPPEFYVGLERRMKRYYRQLFLGENDDDSSDFEVNPSMVSPFMSYTDTRKNKEANVTAEEYSITGYLDDSTKKRRLTKSTNESQNEDASESPDKYVDKLIDTCATYNDTEHISVDSKSSVEDPILIESHSTNESNHSNKTDYDPNPNIEANGSTHFGSKFVIKRNKRKSGQSCNVSGASDEIFRRLSSHKKETKVQRLLTASELTRASLDSDKIFDTENIVEYNDTVGRNQEDGDNPKDDIEEPDNLSGIQTDNKEGKIDDEDKETKITGIQNASIDWNKDDVDDDDDVFDNAIKKGLFASKARKMVFISSSDESFDNMEPIAQSSAKSIDDEEIEVMRDARVTGVDQSCHGETIQDSPVLAFETQADADKLENESSDSKEERSEEDKEDRADPRNTLRDIARILYEFWSVSPEDVDIESPKKRVSGSNKRKTDSSGDAPSTKRKKDIASQTRSEETHSKWEDIKAKLIVGTPSGFRLCHCQDHVCS